MSDLAHLETAIADLQSRRALLGDAVVDAAVATLRAQLDAARAAAAASAAAPAPRLRQLSILFADIAGSTALLQSVSADEALALLSPLLQRCAAVVRDAGGEVLRFTGDGLKAAFGTGGTREDEAERAVRAGLAILREAQAHTARVQASHGIAGLGMRVGVHSGPVVLGGGVEADRSAMGHAVHLAARMEQSAPVGRLRISHETWTQVRGLFEVEAKPPLVVRGHDQPLSTYIVVREAADPEHAPQRGVEGVSVPMLGRGAEWDALGTLFERCANERRPGCAWVIGDAGLGKTRLRRELLQACGPRAALVLQARAHPSGQLQPYGLLRQQLARWFDIADDLPAAAARERFEQALAPRLRVDGLARARRLGHLLGLDWGDAPAVQALGARELREQGFEAWREALRSACQEGPGIVVFDDLHWADDASLDFVQRLAADPGAPMLLLLLARPALHERRPLPTGGDGSLVLPLSPLPAAGGEALAAALLVALEPPSPRLQRMLVERAAGNPFYMEELLRVLIDGGAVDARSRPWRLDEARLDDLRVPETLVGVLQARLDALPADELAALQQASIVGPVFWDAALAAVDDAAPAVLPQLEQRTLVATRPASAFANTAERAFHHALLHEVTYGTVLTPARRAGHRRVAQWLGEQHADRAGEFASIAAEHYERGGDSVQAFACYERASRLAKQRFAHGEVLALLARALALTGTPPRELHFRVLLRRASSLQMLGRAAEAMQTLDAAMAHAERHDDDAMRADVLTARMLQADHEGRPDEAMRLAHEALACAARDGSPRAAAPATLAHGELAWLAVAARDFAAAERHLAHGMVQARVAADVPGEEGGYDGYEQQLRLIEMHALMSQARHADAAIAAERALRSLQGRSQPFPLDRLNLYCELSHARRRLGDFDAAEAAAESALALAAQVEFPRARATALACWLELALARDDRTGARALLEEVGRIVEAIGYAPFRPKLWDWRAELARRDDDGAAARESWRQAELQWRTLHDDIEAAACACRRAALLDDRAEALRLVEVALAAAAADGQAHHGALAPEVLLDCHAVLAAAGDVRAAGLRADLQQRLAQQLAQLPDAAARERLLRQVPHWRAAAQLAAGGAA